MLVTLKEILEMAEERKMAAGSFNTPNLESLQAVIGAAEELKLPVIVQFAQCHEDLMPLSVIGPIMVRMAKEADVPVCVHLDHGETLEYLEKKSPRHQFGVMTDTGIKHVAVEDIYYFETYDLLIRSINSAFFGRTVTNGRNRPYGLQILLAAHHALSNQFLEGVGKNRVGDVDHVAANIAVAQPLVDSENAQNARLPLAAENVEPVFKRAAQFFGRA